jgi:hypothetical protein
LDGEIGATKESVGDRLIASAAHEITSSFNGERMVFAAERRASVARGGNPWNVVAVHPSPSPGSPVGATVVWFGRLVSRLQVVLGERGNGRLSSQGFPPLATDAGRSAASTDGRVSAPRNRRQPLCGHLEGRRPNGNVISWAMLRVSYFLPVALHPARQELTKS